MAAEQELTVVRAVCVHSLEQFHVEGTKELYKWSKVQTCITSTSSCYYTTDHQVIRGYKSRTCGNTQRATGYFRHLKPAVTRGLWEHLIQQELPSLDVPILQVARFRFIAELIIFWLNLIRIAPAWHGHRPPAIQINELIYVQNLTTSLIYSDKHRNTNLFNLFLSLRIFQKCAPDALPASPSSLSEISIRLCFIQPASASFLKCSKKEHVICTYLFVSNDLRILQMSIHDRKGVPIFVSKKFMPITSPSRLTTGPPIPA